MEFDAEGLPVLTFERFGNLKGVGRFDCENREPISGMQMSLAESKTASKIIFKRVRSLL